MAEVDRMASSETQLQAIRARIASGDAELWDAAVLSQHIQSLDGEVSRLKGEREVLEGSRERLVSEARVLRQQVAAQDAEIERLKSDASTVAHLRSVSERIAAGRGVGAHLSDAEIAGRVRMQSPRDLDHEMVCVMGRDRIIALSNEVSRLKSDLTAKDVQLAEAREARLHEMHLKQAAQERVRELDGDKARLDAIIEMLRTHGSDGLADRLFKAFMPAIDKETSSEYDRSVIDAAIASEGGNPSCVHDRLNEDGICRQCGEDRRRG